jgi:hypothetical protein
LTRIGSLVALAAVVSSLLTATHAAATPVADTDAEYTTFGRVFPDPLAGCQDGPESLPCSPNAQGNVPATQFIQFTDQEFLGGLRYMNEKWSNYMEVWALDGKVGAGAAETARSTDVFPGNTLDSLEFDPDADFQSAGLPTSRLERDRSDLIVVRVTDESVPDAGKKRYALSLSIHGIERAGAEGGTRAIEDLVTAEAIGTADDPILPADVEAGAPTFAEVLDKTIIYFTYPNPDGWRRGNVFETDFDSGPGVFFQRYNGNGVDPNRDWPDIGYSFRGYSGMSEPETRAFASFYDDVRERGGEFAAGDDLHGMVGADALSYTMLPHGRHDFAKDHRLRETAETIHHVSEKVLSWSPIIQPNDAPQPTCINAQLTDECAPMYGQTWGTVYDTINYTTTGTLGDWFDSRAGLNADGIDNEMAFSHLDKNVAFDPHTEQLHVDGNKALIYAHVADILDPPAAKLDSKGQKGFVPNTRLTRAERETQPAELGAQPSMTVDARSQTGTRTVIPFPQPVQPDNGGMRVEVTLANAQGIAPSYTVVGNQVRLRVECKGCDDHHGPPDGTGENADWIVVSEDYNQRQLYMAAGLIATVNRPEGTTKEHPVDWRLVVTGVHGAVKGQITFTKTAASADGNSATPVNGQQIGDEAPRLAGYDVANTDFFDDLEEYDSHDPSYTRVDPRAVISGDQSLAKLDTLVLADDALPGYTGPAPGEHRPTGPKTADFSFEETKPTTPGDGLGAGCRTASSVDSHDFAIGANDANATLTGQIQWATNAFDWDIFVLRKNSAGRYEQLGSATSFNITSGRASETVVLSKPQAGEYRIEVVNCTAADPNYSGSVTFTQAPPPSDTDTGAYTVAERDAWLARLKEFVTAGGNLVLTDGAVRALPGLTSLGADVISKRPVYVGQVAFSDGDTPTTDAPLAAGVVQPGARFNDGMRRQTYESTPLGFAIQDAAGNDQSNAIQWDVDKQAWEQIGGRYDGGSVDSGTRNAVAVYDRVGLGELALGKGRIRLVGALLPQPSTRFDHPLGVEPYALTYTGYILAGNLLDWTRPCKKETPSKGKGKGQGKPGC